MYTQIPAKIKAQCESLLTSIEAKKSVKVTFEITKEKCDVMLTFCPVVSRLGTDVEAAVKSRPTEGNYDIIFIYTTLYYKTVDGLFCLNIWCLLYFGTAALV